MRLASLLALLLGVAAAAPLAAPPAAALGVGVVILHARGSWPGYFDNVVPKLAAAGYHASVPDACWSVHRIYAAPVDDCMADVDAAIADLKGRGLDRIVLAGHDLGGAFAIYYAARHPELAGVIVWGPRINIRNESDENLELARAMVKAGDGDKKGNFNNGRMYASANAMLSFEAPEGALANFETQLPMVHGPLLWIAANDDVGPRDPMDKFKLAAKNDRNKLARSTTDHYSMVDVEVGTVVAWLNELRDMHEH
jgi:pimeloyl-ACP methyl ester carboxylesterase